MKNKLVVIIKSLKVPKIEKTLLFETKFLVPNYSCLQNPWLGVLCPLYSTEFVELPPPRTKFMGMPRSCQHKVDAAMCNLFSLRWETGLTERWWRPVMLAPVMPCVLDSYVAKHHSTLSCQQLNCARVCSLMHTTCPVSSSRTLPSLLALTRTNVHIQNCNLTHWGRVTQICVFNTRLFSLHNILNYAIHRACLRMVLLTDVCRNLTSLWINL